ncbi:putative Zn-dependent peptidase [Bacillus mesophilus]|uniref:Insulinase family protein n=1 Tax=Bacillus mesophilus TaxID=1808955 RepID=A0A6M0Q336_9BACI|nr:pitrilysin family protein [Bacillus mesophilus]MBM7659295.1 putative Zn-dependent peptidase [Bacillus mesophilus]NEY70169.1 insulinase family protein [Bacillus mesophilus]
MVKLDQEIVEKMNGLSLHVVETKKYKTNTLVMKLKAPLTKEDVTHRALLPHVLQSGTNQYPSTTELRSYLDELYGASLGVDLTKKGEYHIITIRVEIANEVYLSDQTPLLEKGLSLLADIVQNPAQENGVFLASIVEKEKRALKQRIQSVFDDKMRYASLRLVEEMCKDEPYSLHANGQMEDVDQITPRSLFEYYQKSLREDEIDLYVVGDVSATELKSSVATLFKLEDRSPKIVSNPPITINKENEVIEEQDVKQGKLNVGYRTNITYQDPEYYALQVFNGIFGGFSHSKLFINVREKASLAYYAASRVESHKGLLMVMSGVDAKNYDQAVSIIKEQMIAMKNADFTDKELEQTKAVLVNQLLETIDTSRGLIEVLYNDVLAEVKQPIDEWLRKVKDVTKEQIIEAGKKIELDTIYFLKGKGEA